MKSIYKFYLDHPEKNFIFVPIGSKILCVQNQKERAAIWFLVPDTDSVIKQERTFTIYVTGESRERMEGEYVGTIQMDNGNFVYHVFEDTPITKLQL
jgi:hypothetical protein